MSAEKALNRGTKERFLTFFLGDESYGIEIFKVREIIAMMKVTKVPKTPSYITGVINLRGSIIPVMDTRLRFGLPFLDYGEQTTIIITEVGKASIGFIVDKVEEVLTIDKEHLSEPPKFTNGIDSSFIGAMAEVGENVVMILDIDKLFEAEEMELITRLNDETNAKRNEK